MLGIPKAFIAMAIIKNVMKADAGMLAHLL
jgi:hypothetical protein